MGKKTWLIPDGYIPADIKDAPNEKKTISSFEKIAVINANKKLATISIQFLFEEWESLGPYIFEIPALRARHIFTNELKDPDVIPYDLSYACIVESDVPIVVQHSRLDARHEENAIFSSIAYSE
ncbi:MAG: sensory rhodopsin transducer [Alphaproteobacteria bacterium]